MADKNYTKFDNDYFTHLSTLDLSGSEFRVLHFILRQSACYKRGYTKDCSYSFISKATGLTERTVKRAVDGLIRKKIISVCNEPSGKRSSSYNLCLDKVGFLSGQIWLFRVDKNGNANIPKMSTKENTEDNSKEIREKRKASPSFSNKKLTLEELAKLSYEDYDEEGEE